MKQRKKSKDRERRVSVRYLLKLLTLGYNVRLLSKSEYDAWLHQNVTEIAQSQWQPLEIDKVWIDELWEDCPLKWDNPHGQKQEKE